MRARCCSSVPKEEFTRVLDRAGVTYDVLPHEHTESAADEAKALGIPPADVAKTLVVYTPSGYLRAVLPASERLDLHKLAEGLDFGNKQIALASEEDLTRDYPEFELGAVPPVGGRSDGVVVDRHVTEHETVVIEAGSHEESVRISSADLVHITGARVDDICREE